MQYLAAAIAVAAILAVLLPERPMKDDETARPKTYDELKDECYYEHMEDIRI